MISFLKREVVVFIFALILFSLSLFLIACSISKENPSSNASLKIQFSDGRSSTLLCPEDLSCSRLEKLIESNSLYLFEMPNQACTMIYGGPETVEVKGNYQGRDVSIKRTRSNGCEIKQYDLWASFLT